MSQDRKKCCRQAEVWFLSLSFHSPKSKLISKYDRHEGEFETYQMGLPGVSPPAVSLRRARPSCDVWALQLQSQGTSETVWVAVEGVSSIWWWGWSPPVLSSDPWQHLCPVPAQQYSSAAWLPRGCGILCFPMGFYWQKWTNLKAFHNLLNSLWVFFPWKPW